MVPPPDILEELYSRSLVPRNCIPQSGDAPVYGNGTLGIERRIGEWCEPITGPINAYEYRGFELDQLNLVGLNITNHTGWMAEVHTRNGVNWRMVRVIYSNPYGPDDSVELLGLHAQPLMDTFNVRLDVGLPPYLSWHSPGSSTLCLMRPVTPIHFETFCRTFRYWLILNIRSQITPGCWTFGDAFLPTHLTPPHYIFFDIVHGCDDTSVSIGPSDNGAHIYERVQISSRIQPQTFAFVWNAYRFWVSWRPLLCVIVFVSRLQTRRADRRAHEPPNGIAFLAAMSSWSDMVAHT